MGVRHTGTGHVPEEVRGRRARHPDGPRARARRTLSRPSAVGHDGPAPRGRGRRGPSERRRSRRQLRRRRRPRPRSRKFQRRRGGAGGRVRAHVDVGGRAAGQVQVVLGPGTGRAVLPDAGRRGRQPGARRPRVPVGEAGHRVAHGRPGRRPLRSGCHELDGRSGRRGRRRRRCGQAENGHRAHRSGRQQHKRRRKVPEERSRTVVQRRFQNSQKIHEKHAHLAVMIRTHGCNRNIILLLLYVIKQR